MILAGNAVWNYTSRSLPKSIFMIHKVGSKQSEAMFVVEEGWTQTCLKRAFIWKKPVEAE